MGQYGHPFAKVRLKQTGSSAPIVPPIDPNPTPVIEFNPNFVVTMSSTVIDSPSQRAQVVTDIVDTHNSTGGQVRPDICANVSWDDLEDTVDFPGMGNYEFTRFVNLRGMCQSINTSLGLPANSPNGSKYYAKLYLRNYSSGLNGVSLPSVPRYMRAGATVGPNVDVYKGTSYLGAGVNANAEYQGTLGAGFGAGNLTRQAKVWVPEVAERWKQLLIAVGTYISTDPLCAGYIINETSVLNAADSTANPYGTSVGSPGSPTANAAIITQYFQNYFQAIIDARPFAGTKEVFISAGHPVATIYGYQPLNPGVLFSNYKISQFIQDAFKLDTPTPKYANRVIATNTQPHAITSCSFACLISGDVRRIKAVDNTQLASSTTNVSIGLGLKSLTISEANKTFVQNRVVNAIANTNESTQALLTGTVNSWTPGAANTTDTGVLVINVTSIQGTGARASWDIAEGPDYYPPHTLDQMVTYNVTKRTSHPWDPINAPHNFEGATHVFFQINTSVKTGLTENSRNYVEYFNYFKTTANRVKTQRPLKL